MSRRFKVLGTCSQLKNKSLKIKFDQMIIEIKFDLSTFLINISKIKQKKTSYHYLEVTKGAYRKFFKYLHN